MKEKSAIQWTDYTWNIARGCTKVDEDCKFCYMYRDSFDSTRYNPLQVIKTKTVFNAPLKIKEPSKIFTCSLTDFFHEGCDSFRGEAWDIILKCPHHTFQILTKRPERIIQCLPEYWDEIKDRVWLGTSVGSVKGLQRIDELIKARRYASVLFISFEPLYEAVAEHLSFSHLNAIDWVIIGGESGNETGKYQYRPCEIEWMKDIAYDYIINNKAVFVKQMGTYLSKQLKMDDRHGSNMMQFPAPLRLRMFPREFPV